MISDLLGKFREKMGEVSTQLLTLGTQLESGNITQKQYDKYQKAYAQEVIDTNYENTGKRRPKRWNPGYDASDMGPGFDPSRWYEE